jgi:hypothetical protein
MKHFADIQQVVLVTQLFFKLRNFIFRIAGDSPVDKSVQKSAALLNPLYKPGVHIPMSRKP